MPPVVNAIRSVFSRPAFPDPVRTLRARRSRTTMRFSLLLSFLLLGLPLTGEARTEFYQLGDQSIEVDLDSDMSSRQRAEVMAWIRSTADALAAVYGRLPRDELKVRVRNYRTWGSDPVPWAQVNRGDPDVVSFYIDPNAGQRRLQNNWTAYHEFSHLLIPYRGWGDMWFSEGLASYYQNLLQARLGVFDEREMWQRLHDGFVRGRNNKRPDLTLAELSPAMRENRSYMRVYWSGAWYFFRADVELRQRTEGRQSLDTALEALNRCCADASMSAREIATTLDRLTGQLLFVPLFDQVASSRALPPFEEIYEDLGIRIQQNRVSLLEAHPQTPLRSAIARRPEI